MKRFEPPAKKFKRDHVSTSSTEHLKLKIKEIDKKIDTTRDKLQQHSWNCYKYLKIAE